MAVPNFPTKPGFGSSGGSMTFPKDLNNGSRQFYTQISFVQYNSPLNTVQNGEGSIMGSTVTLPIPRRLNDNEVIIWEEFSGKDDVMSAARAGASMIGGKTSAVVAGLESLGPYLSMLTGTQINPFQFMMFKRPMFKEHTFTWTLAPNSQEESDSLNDIIKECKRAALPPSISGFVIDYPKLAMVSFKPSGYLYRLKPCVIVAVQVDYTAAGQPSFFKSGAPTIVNLTLQLKEYQLQSAQDI
jgi:hypothetical protein